MIQKLKKFILTRFAGNQNLLSFIKNIKAGLEKIQFAFIVLFNPMDEKMILFEAFGGVKYTCSPKAVYEKLITDERFADYKFVWVFKKEVIDNFRYIEKENPNTNVEIFDRKKFYLAKAKYVITNWNAPLYYFRRKGQIFTEFWHGKPLKRAGCDVHSQGDLTRSTKQMYKEYRANCRKYTYMIAPSKVAGEVYKSGWDLKDTSIIKYMGYPRNDFLFNYTEEDANRIKKSLGVPLDKKVVLYAPTFRDNQYKDGQYTYQIEIDFDRFQKELGDEYVILLRVHYLAANSFDGSRYKGFVYNVYDYPELNDLFIISDVLVADYSSLIFDYADVRKPMIFYMYDLEDYRKDIRGLYFDITRDLPGPVVQNQDDLLEAIKNYDIEKKQYEAEYDKFVERYSPYDNGNSANQCIDLIFFNKEA